MSKRNIVKGIAEDELEKKQHEKYIHQMGMSLLQMRLREDKLREMDKAKLKARQDRVHKLLRKKVRVTDMDQGGLSVQIDQEWDTSFWSDEMIDAGCEALTLLFCSVEKVSEEKKHRAVVLLEKLLFRHESAQTYVKRNMESFVGQCVNRSLRRGKTAAILDIFYILKMCKLKFIEEISRYNYCGSFCEMISLECRLAAILIQHTFRTHKTNKLKRAFNPDHIGFGTEMEVKMYRRAYQNSRNFELRMNWRMMHWSLGAAGRKCPGGLRGPAHFPEKYVLMGLEVMLQLVHESAGECATRNREDSVRSNACIILSCMMSFGDGPFAALACKILTQLAKVGDSVIYAMSAGVPRACERYFKTIKSLEISRRKEYGKSKSALTVTSRTIYADAQLHDTHIRTATPGTLSASARETLARLEDDMKASSVLLDDIKTQYIDCALTIKGLATHAAGIFCARNGYAHKKIIRDDREDINYFQLLRRSPFDTSAEHLQAVLGDQRVLRQLVEVIMTTPHMSVLHSVLRAVLALACSDCAVTVLPELLRSGGKLMMKLIDLLEEQNLLAASLSMSIFLQLATTEAGRSALTAAGISRYLIPFAVATSNYNRLPYQRAVLILSALCRQHDWRAYDPDNLPQDFILNNSNTLIREHVLLDLMRSLKSPALESADNLTLSELVLMPFHDQAAEDISVVAEDVGSKEMMDFVSHPGDVNYFTSLSWPESAACCQIMAALSAHRGAAENMGATASAHIDFIGQYLFNAQQTLRGAPLGEQKLAIILHGAAACGLVLNNLSCGSIGHPTFAWPLIHTVKARNITSNIVYFIDLLGDAQTTVTPAIKKLQLHVGKCILKGFDGYSSLLISMHAPETESLLLGLGPGGQSVCNVVKRLSDTFDASDVGPMLDRLCAILANLTSPKAGAFSALNDWKVLEAIRRHLPHALSAIGPLGLQDNLYINGLGRMSVSFFNLCTNLAQLEKGRNYLLADGFLRRAIEKVMLLFSYLESNDELSIWKKLVKQKRECPPSSRYRQEVSSSLRFIAAMCNHHHAQFGSANDQILSPSYEIAEVCSEIMKTLECPRKDECYEAAIAVVAGLCADGVIMSIKSEALDILHTVAVNFVDVEEMQLATISNLVDIVAGVYSGVRTPYLMSRSLELRAPLTRIGRLFDSLAEKVRETNWVMSKMGISMREMSTNCDKYIGIAKSLGLTGVSLPTTPINRASAVTARRPLTSVDSEYLFFPSLTRAVPGEEAPVEEPLLEDDGADSHELHSTLSKLVSQKASGVHQSSDADDEQNKSNPAFSPIHDKARTLSMPYGTSLPFISLEYDSVAAPGSYNMCGPSSCGSLKLQDSPAGHGSHSHYSEKLAEEELRQIGMFQSGQLLLSHESLPASQRSNALKRMDRFLNTHHEIPSEHHGGNGTCDFSSYNNRTAVNDGGAEGTRALLLATTGDPKFSMPMMNSKFESRGIEEKRLISSAPVAQKSKLLSSSKQKHAPKRVVSVSIDEIPELMMTKPLTPLIKKEKNQKRTC